MFKRPLTPLARRRRQSARLALYLSLLLTAAVAGGLFSTWRAWLRYLPAVSSEAGLWQGVDFGAMPEVRFLQRYVGIDTSFPDGDERAAVRFLEDAFRGAGLAAGSEYLGHGRANFWAILEGESPEAVVLHHHIDVEALREADRWHHPAFSGAIEGPWIYGRGIYDMKSVAVAQAFALFELARSGVKPKRSVIFLGTSGEETGSDLGVRWILRQHPELVRRFGVVLTEGGVVEAAAVNEVKYWGIEFGQKHFVDLTFCSESRERLEELAKDLETTGRPDWPHLVVHPEIARFLAEYGPSRDFPLLGRLVARPEQLLTDPEGFSRLTPFLQSQLRNELHAFRIEPAPGGGWQLPTKIHLLPGQDLAAARRLLVPPGLADDLAQIVRDPSTMSPLSSTSHPAFLGLVDAVRTAHPQARVGRYFLTWSATDARFFRTAGIPAYGFSPFLVVAADTLTIGRPDERISLHAFVEGVRLYTEALRRLVA